MTPHLRWRPTISPLFVKFVVSGTIALGAGEWPAVVAQPPVSVSRPTDDALAVAVRQAIADHPQLRPHNLSLLVNVLDGVAVIGGPVPDASLTPSIESAAAGVKGVVRVKVSVWTFPTAKTDPLAERLHRAMADQSVEKSDPVVTLSVPTDPRTRPSAGLTARPTPEIGILLSPVVATDHTARSPHLRPPGAEPAEYTPIPATNLPTEPVLEPPPQVRAATPTAEPLGSDWRADARFARLTVEVRGGTAIIGGRARTHSAAWDLAEVVRGWPTVERVVVGQVTVSRAP